MGRALLCIVLVAGGCGGESTGPGDLAPVTSIRIEGLSDTILLGETLALRAILRGPEGQILADRPITWASSDPSVMTMTQGGIVEALVGGTATITASSGVADTSVSVHALRLQFEQIFTGAGVSCGLEDSGVLWCWGAVGPQGTGNGFGDRIRSDIPLRAARDFRFTSLAIGGDFICGRTLAAEVVCWGENQEGQLGNGSTDSRSRPEPVVGLGGATAVAAGGKHACALVGTAMYCWGANRFGQLGDGSRVPRRTPVPVPGIGPVSSLALGSSHTCAVVEGRPLCWGSDDAGQLGHDTAYIRPTPGRGGFDPAIPLPFTTVTASNYHNCGLITGGAVYCWGYQEYPGHFPQLNHSPMQPAPGRTFVKLFVGQSIQCGLRSDSTIWCWGIALTPTQAPVSGIIVDAALSTTTVCMLDTAGAVSCWDPVHARSRAPVLVQGAPQLTSIAAGSYHLCGLSASGGLWCWDDWVASEPGSIHANAAGGGQVFSSVWDGGANSACALTSAGDVWCPLPGVAASPAGYAFTSIGTGPGHACGLTADGTALCWGRNDAGQLGDGTTVDRESPVQVQGGLQFTSIAAGQSHTCASTAGGDVFCWGSTALGQMGDGTGMDSPIPISVDGNPSVVSIAAGGGTSTCGLDPAGVAHCWPVNWQPAVRTVTAPAPLSQVAVGSEFACGLDGAGAAWCWGRNLSGVFGNGQQGFEEQWSPQPVSGAIRFSTIAAGQGNVCGISIDGTAYCWGSNWQGTVGSPAVRNADAVGFPARLYGQ